MSIPSNRPINILFQIELDRLPIRGVREGDRLPGIRLASASAPLSELSLALEPAALGLSTRTGVCWQEGCNSLLTQFTAEYALRDIPKPIGVAEWQTKLVQSLPDSLKGCLPSIEQIEAELELRERYGHPETVEVASKP